MKQVKKLTVIALLIPLFSACSSPPSESIVEGLIENQYKQGDRIVSDAVASAGNDKTAIAMSNMMERMMPKLERIENISCDTTEDRKIYACTADITQSIAGNSRTNRTSFKVYQVNDEWVLGN